MSKRYMVTLSDKQAKLLHELELFGDKDSEKIRNILLSYLSEKSYLKDNYKEVEK